MSLEILRSSASSAPAPGVRAEPQVVKLVDTSTCIGRKACEVACQEWNDLPPEPTGSTNSYQTLPATTASFWNLIKFNEHEDEGAAGSPRWLMRKDQCMHKIRFMAARIFVKAGETQRAQELRAELAKELPAEPRAYAKI